MGIEVLATALVTAASAAADIALSYAAFQAAVFVTSAVITAAAVVGLSYAQQALARTQTDRAGVSLGDNPAGINSPEARGNVKQATPVQRLPVGLIRIGGPMFLYEVKPPYLYVGFLYSSLTISEYVQLYVGEQSVQFPEIVENEIMTPLDIAGQPDFPGRLSVCVQSGALDQGINTMISTYFPELGSRFILPGIPNCVFRCDYGANADEFIALWGNVQIPNFQWLIRGVPLPDVRNPTSRLSFDPSDPEDMYHAVSTWKYSNNASLVQAFWAMMPFGLRAGPDRIDWDSVRESANFDDERVGIGAGTDTQARHTADGLISLGDKPNVVFEAMLTANRGFPRQRAGEFSIFSSQPLDPIFTITDAMLVGGFEFRNIKPKKELANITRCKFIAPDREYQDADGPVLRNETYISADGEEFEQSVRLPFTSTHERAQRLMKGFQEEARLGKQLGCKCHISAYGLREGDVVRRYSETGRYTAQNGLYAIEQWALSDDYSVVSFSLAEYDPTIARDWIASRDELPFVLEAA
jgi:hypothetical protein